MHCLTGDGASYSGTASVTETGQTCQHWDSQTPHAHDFTPANYPSSGLLQNYCRNPDGERGGVWCYTTDSVVRWGFCDVPACPGTPTSASGCGGTLTALEGTVTSPNHPSDYRNNENCEWIITAPEGSTVRLTFDSFNLENGYDFLTIYDGASDTAIQLGRFTGDGSDIPDHIHGTSNMMFVRFTSDGSYTAQGFRFLYTVTPTIGPGCGGTLTAPEGSVSSPNYPSDYGNNENCEWIITAPEGSTVRLTFDSFNLENGYDFLTIYDGDSESALMLGRFTGDTLAIHGLITSTSNTILMRFTSDGSNTAQGFQLSYTGTPTSASGCGGTLTAPRGIVTSPNYPSDYGNNENCEWIITAPKGSTVRLTLDSFNLENGYDFLTIYDGDSDTAIQLGRFTGDGSDIPDHIHGTSNIILVRFTSDGSYTAQGFRFLYTASPCMDTSEHCESFASAGECDANPDYMLVQCAQSCGNCGGYVDGCSESERQCSDGSCIPDSWWCDGWHDCPQDDDESECEVTPTSSGCGGTLTAPEGNVTSPNHPSDYGNNENCEWIITVPGGSTVSLTFDSFNLESGYDFLTIYDGDSDSALQLHRY
ncbi:exoskeleton protein RP43-like [Branchiostoma lanceolatum]|uniref:exoskeleton protein RP43-like n=1 Tax=Branchiostoma lanceolatum TaxID=7740 RepID=UPI0034556BB4